MAFGNYLKTAVLLALLTALLLWVCGLFGRTGFYVALVLVLAMNFGSYWFSDKIVLRMYKARHLGSDNKVYSMVKEIAEKAGLPMPKVCMIPTDAPNAFAVGRSPKHAAVAVTRGIVNTLSDV